MNERRERLRALARERYAHYHAKRRSCRSFDGRFWIDELPTELLHGRGRAFLFFNPNNNRSFTLRVRTF